jgi:hypothetical protein
MVEDAEKHAENLAKDRIRATEYYRGIMSDTPADKGRSAMVSRDLRANIKKVLPSLMRTLLGSDNVVEYQPQSEGDERGAQQATDYINLVVVPESDIRRHVEDALHDALLLRNGILKAWFEEKKTARISSHTGLPEEALAQLVGDADTEVLEQTQVEQMTEFGPVTLYDVRIKRIVTSRKLRVAAVPRERFLIHSDAVTLEDAVLVGEKLSMSRSDLIAMGYDRDVVMGLGDAGEDDVERSIRRDYVEEGDEIYRLNGQVDYYDIFVRYDEDGDGIAELRHMCFAGGLAEKNLLRDEDCDEVQFYDIKVMSQPHQWEGISLADDLMDIQRVKTVLMRQTLDNLYWQNNPQQVYQAGTVQNPDAVLNPEFGRPIRIAQGADVRSALGFNTVPFVAQQSFSMLEYMDQEAQDRTGVSDASAGLAPDALQNMTATAASMMEQAAIGQTELMVKTAAEGLRNLFRGLLRLLIRHQDVARTVRLRGEWVQFDPRDWNAEMDCSVNVGLGAGTRERDMAMMGLVMQTQEKLLASFGPKNNPYVTPENLWNSLSKLAESAGLRTPTLYFTEPDPEQMRALMQQPDPPPPEQIKAEAAMQLKQAEMQMTMQIKQLEAQMRAEADKAKLQNDMMAEKARMEVARDREAAQLQADLATKTADREAARELKMMEIAWQREKFMIEQRVAAADRGEILGPDGLPVNEQANAIMQALAATQAMVKEVQGYLQVAAKPKRVIRDADGEIVGVAPYDGLVN